jgi:hypothetical protein
MTIAFYSPDYVVSGLSSREMDLLQSIYETVGRKQLKSNSRCKYGVCYSLLWVSAKMT